MLVLLPYCKSLRLPNLKEDFERQGSNLLVYLVVVQEGRDDVKAADEATRPEYKKPDLERFIRCCDGLKSFSW
jgi:hypothetical protein